MFKIDVNSKIEQIFNNLIVDGIQIPISFMSYEGKSSTYLTYYTWIKKPLFFSDDDYQEEVSYVTIDLWSNGNYKNISEIIKQKLRENNFIWVDNGPESYELETNYYHVPINFYIESSQLAN